MTSQRPTIPDYFVSPCPGLWRVTEDGEAISWYDHERTAFMLKHLQVVLVPLTKELGGLPPLSAILFIMDALSKGWSKELATSRISKLVRDPENKLLPLEMINDVRDWLAALGGLPVEFCHGPRAHLAILSELLEGLPESQIVLPESQAEQTLSWIDNAIHQSAKIGQHKVKRSLTHQLAVQTVMTLDFAAMKGLDAETLRLRMDTGLDQLPQETENPFQLPDPRPLASLLHQLQKTDDQDLNTAVRMALAAYTTLSLPRKPTQSDVLPIGGVSDVTNKGQPERLLITELAVEPDLLIARIANQQALYLRREYPPTPQVQQRRMWVECGIRCWGTPRLVMSSVALALCASEEMRGGPNMTITSVAGDQHWDEDFTTREGLLRYFERLSSDPHPGPAVSSLVADLDDSDKQWAETILVITSATARDLEFHNCLAQVPMPFIVAKVEPDGSVELSRYARSGVVTLQRCQLNLEVSHAVKTQTQSTSSIPAFLRLPVSPLRYAAGFYGRRLQVYQDDDDQAVWVVSQDRRVLCYREAGLGAIHVGNFPSGKILASQIFARDLWCLVVEQPRHGSSVHDYYLIRADLNAGVEAVLIDLPEEDSRFVKFEFDRTDLLAMGKRLSFINTVDGSVLASTQTHLPHLGGAFFGMYEVFVASRQQTEVDLIALTTTQQATVVVMRCGSGSPVFYASDLSWMRILENPDSPPRPTGVKIVSNIRPKLESIHASGTHALLRLCGVTEASHDRLVCKGNTPVLVEVSLVDDGEKVKLWPQYTSKLAFDLNKLRVPDTGPEFKKRYTHIGLSRGRIVLRSTDFDVAISFVDFPQAQLKLTRLTQRVSVPLMPFGKPYKVEMKGLRGTWTLRHVKLPCGEGWLDSRGLLHLRAAYDDSELSIVLANDCAGWHSSGATFGNSYFTDSTTETPRHIIDWFEEFTFQQCST